MSKKQLLLIFFIICIFTMSSCENFREDIIVYPNNENKNYEEEILDLFQDVDFSEFDITKVSSIYKTNLSYTDIKTDTYTSIDQSYLLVITDMIEKASNYEYTAAQAGLIIPDITDKILISLEKGDIEINIILFYRQNSQVLFTYKDSNVEYDVEVKDTPFAKSILEVFNFIDDYNQGSPSRNENLRIFTELDLSTFNVGATALEHVSESEPIVAEYKAVEENTDELLTILIEMQSRFVYYSFQYIGSIRPLGYPADLIINLSNGVLQLDVLIYAPNDFSSGLIYFSLYNTFSGEEYQIQYDGSYYYSEILSLLEIGASNRIFE